MNEGEKQRYFQLIERRIKVREQFERQKARVASQQLLCDSFIVKGKKIPWLYRYNLETLTRKMYDLEGFEMYLSNEIERIEAN